jgi:c-di-GMP-binding flagellar brake protein YcgR
MASSETRSYPRKVVRCPIMVAVPGSGVVRGRTIDVSLGGISLTLAEQLPTGLQCDVAFDPMFNGETHRIIAKAKVVYSILSGKDGFRVGLQFVSLDAENNKLLAQLMI